MEEHWIFVSHHKTGTVLLDTFMHAVVLPLLRMSIPGVQFEKKLSRNLPGHGSSYHNPPDWKHSRVHLYHVFDPTAWRAIASAGHRFRLVHLVRDPVELVVSGYWYHMRTDDLGGVPVTLDPTRVSTTEQ